VRRLNHPYSSTGLQLQCHYSSVNQTVKWHYRTLDCCFILFKQYLPPPPPTKFPRKLEYESMVTAGKEQLEYKKWKKEQDRIDLERLQRHRDESGEWKREWDRHKPLSR